MKISFKLFLCQFMLILACHTLASDLKKLDKKEDNPIQTLQNSNTEPSDKSENKELNQSKFAKNEVDKNISIKKRPKLDTFNSLKVRRLKTLRNSTRKPQVNKHNWKTDKIILGASVGAGVLLAGYWLLTNFLTNDRPYILDSSNEQPDRRIFYLYTTGIGSWGNTEIAEFWQKSLRESILSHIPDSFQVVIAHYDPLMDMIDNNSTIENYDSAKQVIEDLTKDDMQQERVSNSFFLPEFFDHNQVERPHLVIDFAHIYEYTNIKKVKKINDGEDEIPLNAIYFGYLGNDENLKYRILSLTKLIEIDATGSATTYIDKLIENGYSFPSVYPSDFFDGLLKGATKNLEEDHGLPLTTAIDLIDETKNKHLGALMDFAMSEIWKNTPQDLLIENLADFIVKKQQSSLLFSYAPNKTN
ncbi:MAG: hypothetical protein AB8G05_12935 [Oligoflexales bacterium]